MRRLCFALMFILAMPASLRAEEPADGAGARLSELSREMLKVAEKLRAKKVDESTIGQGSSIEQRLASLIAELEGIAAKSVSAKEDAAASKPKASRISAESKEPAGTDAQKTAPVATESERWAKLPPAQREEMLQALRQEMPERWRKRLEAYFLSLADEKKPAGK